MTIMGRHPLNSIFTIVSFLTILFNETSQNTRNKRQIQPELPRILTQNGHLVFQSGINHNITFQATSGGFVNINGENFAVITQTMSKWMYLEMKTTKSQSEKVKDNKLAIEQLRTAPTASSSIETRLSATENRLNNLQPTGQVQTSLLTLGHRIDLLQATIPSNIGTRLSQIESSLNNLQSTGQVASLINQLTTRVTALETQRSQSSANTSTRRNIRQLQRKVSQLETTVQTLQNLLTTNECSSNPCRNGGTCVDTYNGYFCRCPDSFQGPICDEDVNECSVYAGTDLGCQNGATCVNSFGSFTCQCTANWHGIRCTESHDDCTGASSSELCGHGTCVNVPRQLPGQPKYTCICDDGWTNSGGSNSACVVDVNECTGNRPPCSVNPPVPCINLPGSFTCGSCPTGYNGNGFVCIDINECAISNGGCSMAPMVQCINTVGSRTCGPCPAGYQGDGVTCNWVGVCQDNNGGCHPQAACTESAGFQGRVCTCAPGYVGNGVGSTGCVAQGPVTGACGSMPCMNGAACQSVAPSGYRCVCQAGYTDQNCQTNINECASNPCLNGGSCSDRVNGYVCQCTESFTGSNCQVQQQVCGGELTGESGTFRFPMVPGTQYPNDVSCAWRITTTYGKILRITFPQFNIEAHPQCNYDHLQINDGPTASSYLIGKYCGNTPPNNGQPINSTHHQLYFWFRSDVSQASDGFTVQWTSALPVCGGNLAGADHGEFSSPGYPGNYPHDRDCVWTITVSPGKYILFTFATLAIETHPDCNYDYLEIRDGGLDTSPVLRKYCNTTTPPPLSTTGPTAWVKFHSDATLNDQGFHITYAAMSADAGCGGTFTSETGILISPNYPNAYAHDAQCVWIVTVNDRDRITLTFTNLDLEGQANCQYDYIEVRDGSNENAPLIGRYCGDAVLVPLTTTQNVLYVKFVSDSSVTRAGFRATWEVFCGGVFTSLTGVIRSPYFPEAYPSNRQCEYFINQPDGNRVTLTFNTFDIEGHEDCSYDFLEVRDGGSSSSPVLGTFCGPQVPSPITTTGNLMYLKFVTDGSVQNLGFQATYVAAEGSCGGPLTADTGSITSPGHPNVYPHGVNCTWNIEVTPGLVVRLTFHTFSIESHTNCYYDNVAVYDNSTTAEASVIGRYCGSTMPPVQTSTNNVMTVQFVSDASISHEGFSASYVALNASTLCGSDYTDVTGMITSPNYPNNYPHQRECLWTITAPEGNQILLNITDFNLEQHPNCNYDFLEIRNGGFASSPLVGKYCGTTVERIIISHSNRMFIKLVTDNSQSAPGFRLYYDSTATGCGADLSTPTGSFVSPNYPMPYRHNAECFYRIQVARGSRIQFSLVDMDIEAHADCNYDYIEVREVDENGPLLGRFCGSSSPEPLTSSTNALWVKYRTDYSVSGRGFHAFYSTICSNTLTAYSGVIESPNFPNPYPHNRNCTWVIDVAMGNTVNISFSHFGIEAHTNCQYDYLQINDGGLETSPTLGTFCGSNLPSPIASTTDKVWLKFMSDFSVAMNGFRLEYITNGCGGYLRTPTGSFTSPGYPNPYPHRRQCEWTIVANTGSYIQLTIETFDLESHSQCLYDVLEIYGGPDDSAPRLAQLCHTQSTPQVLSSTGNMMFVRFRSDFSISGNGFSATYKTASGGCGGNYTMPSGTIVSKNYPNNYPHNTDCEWLITVPERHNVELTFVDFDVEGTADCRYDYVALFDGNNMNATELMRFCGNTLPTPVKYRSRGNQMFVRMRTDQSISAKGFKADYVTGCGGIFNGDGDGDIISPGYPGNYPRGSNCSWVIMAEHASDRITLTFTHMDLENANDCNKDYVEVLDGNDEQAPLIGRYCGRVSPSAITSQGSALFVQFVSDMSVAASGFRAAYSKASSACGGDYTSERGSFTSPGFPNNYPINTECVWTVGVAPGSRVELSFSFFNLENHETCNYDYLELHAGGLGGPLLGRFCGTDLPSNLTAYNGIWVKFRSDESGTGQGFVASYSAVYGGDITGSSGQIASPLYPYQYPHNANIMWIITVETNMRVRISFTTMDMESALSGCVFDYLKIRDGGSMDSPVVGTYCGTTLPSVYISSGNQLHIEFHSDWSSTGQGFLLDWSATSDQPITTLPPTAGTTPVPGCGGTLNVTDVIQTVTSPGYPNGYQNRLDCTWVLNTPVGSRIWMNITDIDIEAHQACNYDILRIYNSVFTQGIVLGTFCGRTGNTQPLISSRNGAAIKFTSDFSVNGTGFSLQYKKVCGGIMQVNSGVIQSDNYPSNYPANSNCSWSVVVPAGRTIRVTFNTNFNIQGTQGSCAGDYVQLLNGNLGNSPPLGNNTNGRYCGNTAPAVMETSSNFLNVQFISDGSGSAVGFGLSFTEVHITCSGQLSLDTMTTSGSFMSPNYPQNYPQNVDCVWVITAPAHERIQVDFLEDFGIEMHSNCNFDFIELRDGGTINSPSLGKFCGYTHPSTVISTGNVMYARFRTDTSVSRIGFKTQYKIATCGGRYVGRSGTLTSPNYPSNYDNNAECIWTIVGLEGHFLTFTFTAFNLQNAANCTVADYVEIREINSTGPVILQACGSTIPQPVMTADRFGYVKFVSNGAGQMPGFSLNFEASAEECGGDLTTPTGSFQSPNFPGRYPHSRLCEWRITVQPGRRISFTFNPFNIENHLYCRYDYVAIYNGILLDSPRIGSYCGDNPPAIVETSGNTARVVFRTDGSVTNGGFRAFYTSQNEAECGGLITSSPGNITSPDFASGNYSNRLECIWTLRSQVYENTSIVIRFNVLKLEPATSCRYDWLEVREGDSINGVILDKYCGNNTLPSPIISPVPSVWLRFRTDQSIVDQGFHLSYNFTQCGGILTAPSGVISSPNFPNDYDHNDACAWMIQAPEGTQIVIEFSDFDIENHPNCNYDYLEIFNGPYASSPSIGRFCGNARPSTFRSQTNAVRLVLFTDISLSARGFRLTYAFANQGCGGLYHAPTGNLSTPNYPRSYPHNTECVWDINVEPGYTVTLTFNPPFDMEHHGACDYDFVEVSDTLSNGSLVPLGRWCENILPPVITSSRNRLVVRFRSDASTNGNGFSANWRSGCGGVITNSQGLLLSPGFPNQYANNLRCNYTLNMDPQHFIVLTFDPNNFDIEAGNNCRFDYVSVSAGNSSNNRLLGKYCGTTAPQPISALGQMYITFWTDGSIVGNGFRAYYMVSECGGVYTEPQGVIGTPSHPGATYHNNHNCTWSITVQPDRVIELKFTRFDLETHSTCNYDYLDIFDGPSAASPLIGRFCGSIIPTSQIRSTSNNLTVNFVTDSSITRGGFSAAYTTTYGESHGCGGYLNTTSGRLRSVDGDGDGMYENDLDCRWIIMGGDNKVVQLTISGMDIEDNPTCRYDYLMIYDGLTEDSPLVGKYCGSTIPPMITSTSNVLYVRFYTDVSVTGAGFNATFMQQDALCGGTYTSSSGLQTISSPGYPDAFRRDVRCRWTIDAPTNTDHVELTVTNLNLQTTSGCSPEYMELRDFPLGARGRVVHVCGVNVPPVFESFGRTVQINYAATSGGSTGFRLNYRTATCNRTYSGVSGQIYSPGWPGRYPQNSNCHFQLEAPVGTTVSLYFNSFHIEPHSSCNYDYLEIRNGSSSGSPAIRRLCGWVLPDPVFVSSNSLGFSFITDVSVTYPGYDITYTATTQGLGCGGIITGINGSFTSPRYPGNYTSAGTCGWLVQVPVRRIITITFTDMRNGENCGTDYILIYDGNSDLTAQIGRYCGNEIPATITTTSNVAYLKHVSDGVGNAIAFRLTFTS